VPAGPKRTAAHKGAAHHKRAAARKQAAPHRRTRMLEIHYRAHDGARRKAFVLLPASYRPRHDPPIPLIISPHGRGVGARANVLLWGSLPARGTFAVISPDGEGRRLPRYSWGSSGQIDDLAKMPKIVHRTLPWVHVDRKRIYAFGGSMGGQETLLLLARHPHLLAGVAAFDSVTNFALQYRSFPRVPCNRSCEHLWNGPIGRSLQSLAREEIGGSPASRPLAYAERSPVTYARRIASSCVPLQLWWSVKDRIVLDQARQSGALFRRLGRLNPHAPLFAFVGSWRHSAEMRSTSRLPAALGAFGLLPALPAAWLSGLHVIAPPEPFGCSAG
jgi:dipeptidyl aminopeptidase/acylaminoacyl peptidase